MNCVRCGNKAIKVGRSKYLDYILCKGCIKRHDKVKDITDHASAISRKYGVTLFDYYKVERKQEYSCKICNTHLKDLNTKFLSVDHCHTTLKVRGLLCRKCNRGLGFFNDDVIKLTKAIKYLQS